MNLIELLKQVKDFRAGRGQRHALWLVLLLAIMGAMSGYWGYRPLAEFVENHQQGLRERLGLAQQQPLPSYSTFRRVLMGVDFQELTELFNRWAHSYVHIAPGEWLAIDGKSIQSTVTNYADAEQNFVSVVSVFSHQQGVAVYLQQFENKHASELHRVQHLLQALDLQGVVLTMDALHCQKKLSS